MRLAIPSTLALLLSAVISLAEQQVVKLNPIKLTPTDTKGHFVAPVEVEGKMYNFLLDTGAGRSLIFGLDVAEAHSKQLKKEPDANAVAGKTKAFTTSFTNVKVGRILHMDSKNAMVTEMTNLESLRVEQKPIKISGLIGSSLLEKTRSIFDYETTSILVPSDGAMKNFYKLSAEQSGMSIVPLEKGMHSYPFLVSEYGGEKWAFLLDTGANGNTMATELTKILKLEPVGESDLKGAGTIKNVPFVRTDFSLGGKVKLGGMKFMIVDMPGSAIQPEGTKFAGVIGNPGLAAVKSKIDFDSYTLCFPAPVKKKPAAAAESPAPAPVPAKP